METTEYLFVTDEVDSLVLIARPTMLLREDVLGASEVVLLGPSFLRTISYFYNMHGYLSKGKCM
jgi:hypothetical protein